MKFTVTLSYQQAFGLAEEFAKTILSQVNAQHLALIGYAKADVGGFRDLQETIRGLRGTEREQFIANVRFCFKRLREEKGTDIRGRDYVARVNAYQAQAQEAARSTKLNQVAA